MKKWLKRIAIVFLSVILIFSVIPYFISVSKYDGRINDKPFIESEFIETQELQMHYRRFLPLREKAIGKIVLVHGLGGSTFSWRNNIEALQKAGYLVIAVDLPGFGFSDKKPGVDHSQKNRSLIMWELLKNIDASLEPELAGMTWNLVGHSMGGGSVAAMAMEKPQKVNHLILLSGALFDNNPQFVSQVLAFPPLARWAQIIFEKRVLDAKQIGSFLNLAYGREPTNDEIQGHLIPLEQAGTSQFFVDLARTAKSEPVERLKDSDFLISAIFGDEDQAVPIEQMDELQEIIGSFELVIIKGAAHCPNETDPKEFNEILIRFLSETNN